MEPTTTIIGILISIAIIIIEKLIEHKWGAIVRFRYDKLPTKEVGVFGASNHGKTALIDYLENKLFNNQPSKTTTIEPKNKIGMGSKTIDLPGEAENFYINVIEKYNPEGIVFLVDPQNIENARVAMGALFRAYRKIYFFSTKKEDQIFGYFLYSYLKQIYGAK